MSKLKAILFDIGGVIIRTDDPSRRLNLAQRYHLDRAGIDALVFGSAVAQAAERGEAGEADVWRHVQTVLGLDAAQRIEFEREFWGGDRADVALIEWLAAQRPRFKTALLTNAWSRTPLEQFKLRFGLPDALLERAFDLAISSAAVGSQKPDPIIYMAALQTLGVDAREAVFVDDFAQNVEGAHNLGMHGVHFRSREQALSELNALLKRQG